MRVTWLRLLRYAARAVQQLGHVFSARRRQLLLPAQTMLGAAAIATLADVPFGWEYHCFYGASLFRELDSSGTVYNEFPQAAQLVPAGAKAGESSAAAAAVSPSSTATERVRDALGALSGTCFFMRSGYWTYEVCPGNSVRQYHAENALSGAAKVRTEFSLGTHNPAADKYIESSQRFIQKYVSGADGRSSTVQHICAGNRRDEDGVISVAEPAARSYLITLRSAAMCAAAAAAAGAAADTGGKATRGSSAAAASAAASSAAASAAASPAAAASVGASGGVEEVPVAPDLELAPLRLLDKLGRRCFQHSKDYWTYEVCPTKQVRQYHLEGRKVTTEFLLGKYDPAADKLGTGATYTQTYVNGSGARSAALRVRCGRKNEHTLLGVEARCEPRCEPRCRPRCGAVSSRDAAEMQPSRCSASGREVCYESRARRVPLAPCCPQEPAKHQYVLDFTTPFACAPLQRPLPASFPRSCPRSAALGRKPPPPPPAASTRRRGPHLPHFGLRRPKGATSTA